MLKLLGKFFTNRLAIFTILTTSIIILSTLFAAYLNMLSNYFYFTFVILSVIAAFEILSRSTYPEYKIAWILVVAGLPLFGFVFYLFLGRKNITKNAKQKYQSAIKDLHNLPNYSQVVTKDKITQICKKIIFSQCNMYPFYAKSLTYYTSANKFYRALIKSLHGAKNYIFLEYFIIKPGEVWNKIFEILKQKAAQGIDVRIIYDDFGSILNLPRHFPKQLKKYRIRAIKFNHIIPLFDARMNIRNHRKTAVIDGKTSFISGANIADEYANKSKKYGVFKDFGAKITGEASNSFVISFLDTWQKHHKITNPEKYMAKKTSKTQNIVIPYQDSPLFLTSVHEDVLLNLIYNAKKEIKITTPYLVPTNEIISALNSATRRGVNVSICIPGKPDKKTIYQMSKTFAFSLAQNGIKIYTFTPGFLHSKLFTIDCTHAVVGTSNLDLRSIHSNYEINMFVQSKEFTRKINQDIDKIISQSKQLSISTKTNYATKIYRAIIRLFAPLM